MEREQIDARIVELKTQLEQLLAEANRAIGEINGRIAELERIKELMQPKAGDK